MTTTSRPDPARARRPVSARRSAWRGRPGRLLVEVLAVGVVALLVGLSAAHNAVPQDTFQLAPWTPTGSGPAGASADPAEGKASPPLGGGRGGLLAIMPRPAEAVGFLLAGPVVAASEAVPHPANLRATPSRGPPPIWLAPWSA